MLDFYSCRFLPDFWRRLGRTLPEALVSQNNDLSLNTRGPRLYVNIYIMGNYD